MKFATLIAVIASSSAIQLNSQSFNSDPLCIEGPCNVNDQVNLAEQGVSGNSTNSTETYNPIAYITALKKAMISSQKTYAKEVKEILNAQKEAAIKAELARREKSITELNAEKKQITESEESTL